MAVGQSIITVNGIWAYNDAAVLGKHVTPARFIFSATEYDLDPAIEEIEGWAEKDISAYLVVDENTVEYVCEVPPDEAADYCRTAGLLLADGTLFMLARPAYPMPPALHQRFKIQLSHGSAAELTDFTYLSWYESEQDLVRLDMQAVFGDRMLKQALEISRLKRKLFNNK